MEEIEKSLPESEMSEWKASWRDEYMKWLAAYAYNDGGKLYIGVNDDGYVIGLKDPKTAGEYTEYNTEQASYYSSGISSFCAFPWDQYSL